MWHIIALEFHCLGTKMFFSPDRAELLKWRTSPSLPPSFFCRRCEFPAEMFWRREGASHHTHHAKVILETMKEERRPRRTIPEGRGRKERRKERRHRSSRGQEGGRKKLNCAAATEKRAARSLPKIWQKSPTEAGGRRRGGREDWQKRGGGGRNAGRMEGWAG